MKKYALPEIINDRIFELVKNHHWLEEYNRGIVNSEYTASLFRHKDDYTIAQIMADSDLRGVSKNFYNTFLSVLSIERQMPIIESLEDINSTGQLVFTSKIIRDDLIPRIKHKGKIYKVIDFTKTDNTTDLTRYGFTPDVTYDSARFYIHMTDSAEDLETVNYLSDIANGGFLCASYVSLNNCKTYYDMKFGVSLEVENVNIANAANKNQLSGKRKDFKLFSKIISGKHEEYSAYRKTIPETIKKYLGLNNKEYSELYQLIASKKYLSQIKDNEIYTVSSKSLRGDDIKEAIMYAGNQLFNNTDYNESNLYNPKINAFVAKVSSMDEIPKEFLDFVQEHNLPIYLLGK